MSTNTIVSLIIIGIVAVIFSYLFLNQFKNEVIIAPTETGLILTETPFLITPPTEIQTLLPISTITPLPSPSISVGLTSPKFSPITSPVKTATPTPIPTLTPTSTPTVTATAKIITYTNAGFSPSPLTIKAGETVIYKNESSRSFWPASASHPTHAVYPVYGGCINSIFDACKTYAPGESWSFTFTVKGTWGYHDHINASYFGSVVVE